MRLLRGEQLQSSAGSSCTGFQTREGPCVGVLVTSISIWNAAGWHSQAYSQHGSRASHSRKLPERFDESGILSGCAEGLDTSIRVLIIILNYMTMYFIILRNTIL